MNPLRNYEWCSADNPSYVSWLKKKKRDILGPEDLEVLAEYERRVAKEEAGCASRDVGKAVEEEIRTASKTGRIGREKRKYTKRKDIQYLRPLADNFTYSKILAHFRDDPRWSWPEVAILSEIDVLMIKSKEACHAGREHYAPLARVCSASVSNCLSVLTQSGVITELGYHPGLPSKDRVVSPEYSSNPELSRSIISKHRK